MQTFTTRFTAGYLAGITATIAAVLTLDIGGVLTAIQSLM